jgi:nucleoside-diphosphate-sugar epimerase
VKAVAVFGASGFVGATIVERLLATERYDVRPLIHTSGNAWRLARRDLQLRSVDLLSERGVRQAIDGCTYVINCSRGTDQVMLQGLKILLQACRSAQIQRFVHLSSVAVYGGSSSREGLYEDAPPRPVRGTYGWVKLRQDEMVRAACKRGLPSVVLCPPNISGTYSPYLVSLVDAIREKRLALVDGGQTPCDLVDVQNLAKAIELALSSKNADGTRLFVTDDEEITWRDIADALAPLADRDVPLPSITRTEARALTAAGEQRPLSISCSVRHLLSGDVRRVLREDPLLASLESLVRKTVSTLPKALEDNVRRWMSGPVQVPKIHGDPTYDERFLIHQLQGVRHVCDKAKSYLGYQPAVSFTDSMRIFRSWYAAAYDRQTDYWPLLRELWSLPGEVC